MIRKKNARFYARLGLFLAVFVSTTACGLVPSGATATSAPTATLTPITLPASPTPTPTVQPIGTEADTGWQAEYFNNDSWQGSATLSRVDSDLVFDWGQGSPDPGIPVDHFSVRWSRCVDLEERYYIFTAHADDYVLVLVDDIPVMDLAITTIERPFAVSAGQHCIKVEYKELDGSALMNFSFQPGDSFTSADPSTAWKGEYFNNPDFLAPVTYTRDDPAPIFDWKQGNPAPGIPVDNFSVRWTRCLDLEGRDYIFTARADDYVRVLVDDIQITEASVFTNAETSFSASAGSHCIKVEYQERGGGAQVYFSFE